MLSDLVEYFHTSQIEDAEYELTFVFKDFTSKIQIWAIWGQNLNLIRYT